jgi:hypothetical protein
MSADLIDNKYSSSAETGPIGYAEELTPADVDLSTNTRSIYIGGDGDLRVMMAGNRNIVIHVAVVAGMYYPIRAIRILPGTTASNIVGWF